MRFPQDATLSSLLWLLAADSSLFCWLLLISSCVCARLRVRVRISSSTLSCSKHAQCSRPAHRGGKGNKEANVTQSGCEEITVQWFKSSAALPAQAPAGSALCCGSTEWIGSETPPWPAAARWEWQPRVSTSFVTNIRVLICVPPKHRTPAQHQLSQHKLV